MIVKFTARDLELNRLVREPQPTHGSARARIQNALVRDGLAEFREIDGVKMCLLTKSGKADMQFAKQFATEMQNASHTESRCTMGHGMCPVHKFVHGAEAEELRGKIENLIRTLGRSAEGLDAVDMDLLREDLQSILDETDARDSCAVKPKKKGRSK